MATRLVLHIGMHKTGSSSIQRFLSRNRVALRLFGVRYPPSHGADGRRQPKHNALFTAISHEADHGAPHPVLGPSRALIEKMADRIARKQTGVAVLSAEGFSGERPVFARALAPLGARFDTRIVVFLRRPDDWVESFYKQMVMSREVRESRSFDDFLDAEETRAHLDYEAMLGWWRNAFGPDALTVRRYVPPSDGGAVNAFVDAAGLPRSILHLPFTRARENPSPPKSIVEAMRCANAAEKGCDAAPEAGESYLDHARRKRIQDVAKPFFPEFRATTSAPL